jgi:beta-lactamase class A
MRDIEPKDGGSKELPQARFEALTQSIERINNIGGKIGVYSRIEVRNGKKDEHVLENYAHDPVYGASLGKLPLAALLIETGVLDPDADWPVPLDIVDRSGGGKYDNLTEATTATTSELLDDMLRRSGNTAYRILAPAAGGSEALNEFYTLKGWHRTRTMAAANGRVYLGETTAHEALSQLEAVLLHEGGSDTLAQVARHALEHSEVNKHGIRQHVKAKKITIANKTGEYPGDVRDGQAYRHDVGRVSGPNGELWYSVLTTSDKRTLGILADQVVGQISTEIAVAAGERSAALLARSAFVGLFKSRDSSLETD